MMILDSSSTNEYLKKIFGISFISGILFVKIYLASLSFIAL